MVGRIRLRATPHPSLPASLGEFLLAAVLAGILVAALLVPVVGGIGLAAKRTADSFEDLPSQLTVATLPQMSRVLAADGSTLATFYDENRVNVGLAKVAPVMRQAVVGIEDSRFYEHHGVDLRGTMRAAVNNLQTGSRQGGSTLTQQYVKNMLLETAATPAQREAAVAVTNARKIREARYALALERHWSKDKILEDYLNIAYFGSGAYGVAAAAKHYFNTSPTALTLPQAALLAGSIRNPSAYDPILHPRAALARRAVVLDRMVELRMITPSQSARAKATRIVLHVTTPRNGCIGTRAPFFCDYVMAQIRDNPVFGKTAADRAALLHRGGLTIRTGLDPTVQMAAQKAVLAHTNVTDRVAAVADVVQPGTGHILAMGVNRVFDNDASTKGHTTVDLPVGGQQGVQAGSTFKIFTLTAALEQGMPLTTQLSCPQSYVSTFAGSGGSRYTPQNAEPGGGVYNLLTATWDSVNTCFVQIEERTGTEGPARLAESLGVRVVGGGALNRGGSFTLGGDSISPLAMAGAYAAYAARGRYCPPTAIISVTNSQGRAVPIPRATCSQVIPQRIADTVTSVLRGVITSGTGTAAAIGRPAAGKTGTATDYGAAWFDGYVPQMAAAVWMGDPRGAQRHPLRDLSIGGSYFGKVFGGTISAPIWGDLMSRALRGKPVEQFAGADPSIGAAAQISVPDVTGLSVRHARSRLAGAGLTGVVASGRITSGYPSGTVAGTSPGGGSWIGPGSTVLLYVSSGPAAPRLRPQRVLPTPTPTPTPKPKPSTKASTKPSTKASTKATLKPTKPAPKPGKPKSTKPTKTPTGPRGTPLTPPVP